MFRLPTYQELSKEQDTINNLPMHGTHLVIGPPGTGKTVLAIYRAEMFGKADLNTQFIVYNNTLQQYLNGATKQVDIGSQTRTFHSWFCSWYKQAFHIYPPPQTEPYCYKWPEIYSQLMKVEDIGKNCIDHLIIDEAQDLPKTAFSVLRLIARNLTVFADENQRITESNSTINELKAVLGLEDVYRLSRNYRNTRPIAEFASCFYTGLQTGIAELPDRRGNKPWVVATGSNWEREAEIVTRYAESRKGSDIGVLLPTNTHQYDFYHSVKKKLKDKNLNIPLEMYVSRSKNYKKINFNTSGIKVLSYMSAKGLEFDAVFMPRVDEYRWDPKSDGTLMMFYVLASRARDFLCVMYSGENLPAVLKHVPPDLYNHRGLS